MQEQSIKDEVVEGNNPYQLVWYRADWSTSKIDKNNAKFWEWEFKHGILKKNSTPTLQTLKTKKV